MLPTLLGALLLAGCAMGGAPKGSASSPASVADSLDLLRSPPHADSAAAIQTDQRHYAVPDVEHTRLTIVTTYTNQTRDTVYIGPPDGQVRRWQLERWDGNEWVPIYSPDSILDPLNPTRVLPGSVTTADTIRLFAFVLRERLAARALRLGLSAPAAIDGIYRLRYTLYRGGWREAWNPTVNSMVVEHGPPLNECESVSNTFVIATEGPTRSAPPRR